MRRVGRGVVALSLLLQGCAGLVVERQPASPMGQVSSLSGRPGLVIGAPDGSPDDLLGQLGLDLARQTGFGLVVGSSATGDRSPNRAYWLRVEEMASGPVRLYVELRGGNRQEARGRIEIVTLGVRRDEARKLWTLFELIRNSHLGSRRELPRFDLLVTPALADGFGVEPAVPLRVGERGIRIELPPAALALGRLVYTEILAEFLTECSRLLLSAER